MTFNYRVLVGEYKGEEFFQIHRVYYDEDGIPISYTEEADTVFSDEGLNSLKDVFKMMGKALKKPTLWAGDGRFPEEYVK